MTRTAAARSPILCLRVREMQRKPRQRRRAIDDFEDRPLKRERPTRKPWRDVLKDTPNPESMNYGDAMARLITLRHTEDDEGKPLVDPQQYQDIIQAAHAGELITLNRLRAAIYIALGRLEQPDLEPIEF